MTNEKILKKAISKAVKNGWSFDDWLVKEWSFPPKWQKMYEKASQKDVKKQAIKVIARGYYVNIIFSHDFAKAFWGKGKLGTGFFNKIKWEWHLQQMVLEKDPIKYLEKFLTIKL